MAKRRKIGEKEKKILKFLLRGTLLASALVTPNMAKLIYSLDKMSKNEKYYHKKRFENLHEKGLIYLSGEKVKLSKKGKLLLAKIDTENIEIEKPKKWDGIWQIVSYDIPVDKNPERDYFRNKLIYWGFKKVQKSIWVLPYEAEEEIAITARSLSINPHVMYFTTNHLPNEEKYLKLFNLEQDYRPSK